MTETATETGYAQDINRVGSYLCSDTAQVSQNLLKDHQIRGIGKNILLMWLDRNGHFKEADKIRTCGDKYMHAACDNGHHKYAKIRCKREFCPTCGKPWSSTHKKRVVRAMDRLLWAPVLGYMVFTLPKEISENMPDKAILSQLERKTWDIVKANFSTPGAMVRAHLMGEEDGALHIHINVLFPITGTNGTGAVPQETLNNIRSQWTAFVNELFGLSCNTTNVFYKFAFHRWRKIHNIKYVLRSVVTFEKFFSLADKDKQNVLSLKGWHNTRWYGELSNAKHKKFLTDKGINPTENQDKDISTTSICPVCGHKYKYQEVVHKDHLPRGQLRYVDDDTLIDLESYAHIKHTLLRSSHVAEVELGLSALLTETNI